MAIPPRKISGYRVYCDESNTDGGKRHPVYGAILVALDDLPTVQREIADWRQREDIQLIQFKAIILDRHAPEYRIYSKGNDDIGFYKTYYHWLLRYFAEFPLRHKCKLRVIIDDRKLPRNAKDPFTKLKFALNNGIRKEIDPTADDVVTEVTPLDSRQSDLLQIADLLMGAVGYHNQDFHLDPKANKEKVELARYIAARVGRPTLKEETNPIKEDFKIVRWHWRSRGPKPRYRRRAHRHVRLRTG
jgi:hypothetical protein